MSDVQRPSEVRPGQRWRGKFTGMAFETFVGAGGVLMAKYEDGDVTRADFSARHEFLGYVGGPDSGGTGTAPVMGEDRRNRCPVACLVCGGDLDGNAFVCPPCTQAGDEWPGLITEWDNGARDFPRVPRPVEFAGPSEATHVAVAEMHRAAEIPAVGMKPQRREVSTNGRDWLDYSKLHDPDPFDSYKHRRVDGACLASVEPVGYHGYTFAEHLAQERMVAEEMAFLQKHFPRKQPPQPQAPSPRQSHTFGVAVGGAWNGRVPK